MYCVSRCLSANYAYCKTNALFSSYRCSVHVGKLNRTTLFAIWLSLIITLLPNLYPEDEIYHSLPTFYHSLRNCYGIL